MEFKWSECAIQYRRVFHRFPEPGWLPFFASIFIAEHLKQAGYTIEIGKEILGDEPLMDPPTKNQISNYEKRAKGALEKFGIETCDYWMNRMQHRTGVIAILDTERPGETKGFRFDMDALPIVESADASRVPVCESFQSVYPENSHACGHDGHMAIGLTLAEWVAENRKSLFGKYIFIFQPAEEGVRGAMAFCNQWNYGKIDELYCCHIGFALENTFVAGAVGFLATTKFDVTFHGKSAHAGLHPELGRNALLAAAESAVNMDQIKKPSEGIARLNVGTLRAGEARNTIPAKAFMQVETRGDTEARNQYMKKCALDVVDETCKKYEVTYEIKYQGESAGAKSDADLAEKILERAKSCGEFADYKLTKNFGASDDGAVFMNMVQKQGGQAAYLLFGTKIRGSHHEPQFDFDEKVLEKALHIYEQLIKK